MKYFYPRLWIQNLFLIRRLNVEFSSELKEQQYKAKGIITINRQYFVPLHMNLNYLNRPELKPVEKETVVTLKFPEVEPLNPPVLAISEVSFRYNPEDPLPIFKGVNLSATSDSRICIVGENGAGKSTLLKIIVGQLSTIYGNIVLHRGLRIGYFAQHHVDHLNMNVTCVGVLAELFPDDRMRSIDGSWVVLACPDRWHCRALPVYLEDRNPAWP